MAIEVLEGLIGAPVLAVSPEPQAFHQRLAMPGSVCPVFARLLKCMPA